MKVKDLIIKLQEFDPEHNVYIPEEAEFFWRQHYSSAKDVVVGRYFEGMQADVTPTEEDIEDGTDVELLQMPLGVFLGT